MLNPVTRFSQPYPPACQPLPQRLPPARVARLVQRIPDADAQLNNAKHGYQDHVRQMQSVNRFHRSRATANWLLQPLRSMALFLPMAHVVGLFFPIGIPGLRVNTHEGREPMRLRKHLFQAETSRQVSGKIVSQLVRTGVITSDHHFVRQPTRGELVAIQEQLRLSNEATVKIGWALETFEQITQEEVNLAPTIWQHALKS